MKSLGLCRAQLADDSRVMRLVESGSSRLYIHGGSSIHIYVDDVDDTFAVAGT